MGKVGWVGVMPNCEICGEPMNGETTTHNGRYVHLRHQLEGAAMNETTIETHGETEPADPLEPQPEEPAPDEPEPEPEPAEGGEGEGEQ